MKIELEFEDIVDGMIKLNKKNREIFGNYKHFYSPYEYATNFCEIHCSFGRATGKTQYISTHVKEKDIVFTSTGKVKVDIENLFPICKGGDIENVYIDEPELVFKYVPKKLLYESILKDGKEHTFILLGK
jgi:hypothetical protein